MSSRTITPNPTTSQILTTSLAAPITTTTDLFDVPVEDPVSGSKPVQSYIYPTAAFAVALVVAVQVCRLMERRRVRQRLAMGLANGANGDEEDSALAKLPPPVMHTVYLDKKVWAEQQRTPGWEGIMPLSSNFVVKPEEPSVTEDVEPESGPSRAIRKTGAALRSIGHGTLVVLDALGLYDLFAAEQKRLQAARERAEEAGEEVIDPRLPRDLVAGIMIAMPSRSKTSHEQQSASHEIEEREQLPDVAIGVLEKRWQAGVD
ncbi:hypothetical protein FRC01_012074 [Tulasnella sp. 417]|nr:hypothetical protein FRC01_012074 [Tulasnella sp. 417]